MIIVDEGVLSIRKSRIPFSNLLQIDWFDIEEYVAKIIQYKYSETCFLTIKRKSTGKKYYVDLYDLDNGEDVLNAIECKLKHIKK